jgi:hypothetical protein
VFADIGPVFHRVKFNPHGMIIHILCIRTPLYFCGKLLV